jgi:NADPH:quinone reductase-like Zn-dependent oxidoreductase
MTLKEEFQESCKSLKPDEVVERYLIERTSYFFDQVQDYDEYSFKKDIARLLNVHIRDVVIVGSAKLGFSIKPDVSSAGLYSFTNFDGKKDKSDLDIAVVSSFLFDQEVQNLYDHLDYARNSWEARKDFAKYILKGRLRICFLPSTFNFSKAVKEVQEKYQMAFGRTVNLEIYKSWHYFETYHQQNVLNIHVNLIV